MTILKQPATAPAFRALASLGLGQEHLAALARQGNLHAEGQGKPYFRLRFRMGTKQLVRYVGSNPAFVEQVQRELAQLQKSTQSRRELRRLTREGYARLRSTKRQLQPLLQQVGLCFHGREIRRQPKSQASM